MFWRRDKEFEGVIMELEAYVSGIKTELISKEGRDINGNIIISSYGIVLNKVILSGFFKLEDVTEIKEKLSDGIIKIVI